MKRLLLLCLILFVLPTNAMDSIESTELDWNGLLEECSYPSIAGEVNLDSMVNNTTHAMTIIIERPAHLGGTYERFEVLPQHSLRVGRIVYAGYKIYMRYTLATDGRENIYYMISIDIQPDYIVFYRRMVLNNGNNQLVLLPGIDSRVFYTYRKLDTLNLFDIRLYESPDGGLGAPTIIIKARP